MIFNVSHRHMVFTVPKELRNIFFQDRKKLYELSKKYLKCFSFIIIVKARNEIFKSESLLSFITFGRDLKFNPHIHALVTEGAIDNTIRMNEYQVVLFLMNFQGTPHRRKRIYYTE
jgi:hypothetical protein